ncbi:MAG: divalent-cation tolerance protein CutA [Candidatus Diapherotrites archaeon]|nr:divalent-cation tolerance protein CutA [Candidatus Diapherotrites archaeon]
MIYIGFITCKDRSEAKKIVQNLLLKKLVACGNIIPSIESYYWWKGKMESSNETMLLVKTTKEKIEQIIVETKKVHSYDLPAIEFVRVAKNESKLEKWVKESLGV